MTRIPAAKRSLAGGEIDPDLWYSSDLVPVRGGAATCHNFIVRAKGGVERRPGTQFVAKAADNDKVRLAGFVRSAREAYLAEYSDGNVRLRDANAPFLASPQDVETPYSAETIDALQFAQSNDVQWVFSGQPIKELRRVEDSGAVTFRLVNSEIENGPFLDPNFDETRSITVLSADSVAGSVTANLSADSGVFTRAQVGSILGASAAGAKLWEANEQLDVGDFRRWGVNLYEITVEGSAGREAPVHTSGTQPATVFAGVQAASFRFVSRVDRRVRVDSVTDARNATVTIYNASATDYEEGVPVTMSATFTAFEAGHVGSVWRLEERDFSETPKWENRVNVSTDDVVRYNGRVYICTRAGETSDNPPGHDRGAQLDSTETNAVEWTYLHSGYGLVRITAVTDAQTAEGIVVSRLPGSVAGGTWRWQEGAWSGVRGYPACGTLYSSALWAANTASEPFKLWKSAVEGFNDFEPGTDDDSALTRGLFDQRTEAIQWLASGTFMGIGTEGPEWVARPDENGDIVRVNNLITQVATDEGSAPIRGEVVAGVTVFVDASRTKLVSMQFDFRREAWAPRDLSILAGHILGQGVKAFAYQRTPWPLFWVLLEDGTLGALTYLPDQDVLAWHRHDVGDPVESICVLPVDDGQRDTLFLAVRRGGELLIERMADRYRGERGQDRALATYLDACRRYDLAEPASTFTGLDHLEGRTVRALVDGKAHPEMTVEGGAVTLRFPGRKVVIGLPYESRYKTLPFDLGGLDDFQASRRKRITDLAIAFRNTCGGVVRINGRDQRVFTLGSAPLDAAPELVSDLVNITPPGSHDAGQLEYLTADPWPATITAIFPQFEV
ncbi:hypothetical protein ATO8_19814 [Roseivivax marinus]|uniref:Uncharacterized protein n=1 Tax=Roseivivax marinus TaxID=1379903 RepID=W4HES3_9RHOB|nr:hypothetical protein [Roseivivax marinus]ETW10878.1 hypothetical protein ATO8_19814 [Roseivivax marinus]